MRALYICKTPNGTVAVEADTQSSVDRIKEIAADLHRREIIDVIEERPLSKPQAGEEEYRRPLKAVFRSGSAIKITKPKNRPADQQAVVFTVDPLSCLF